MSSRSGLSQVALLVGLIIVPQLASHWIGSPAPAAVGLFVTIVVLWLTEIIPLAVSALLVPVLASLFGILSPADACAPFGNQILFLLIGVFSIVRSVQKSQLDRRVAFWMLSTSFATRSLEHLVIVVTLVCWGAGMWMSNTATCALLLPISLGLARTLGSELSTPALRHNFTTRLLLLTAFTPSIAGMATPVGSLPNLIAFDALERSGNSVTFVQWMAYGLPVSITLVAALYIILRVRYPFGGALVPHSSTHFRKELKTLGPISRAEALTMGCFVLAVVLWLIPGIAHQIFPESSLVSHLSTSLAPGIVAIAAATPLFVLRTGTRSAQTTARSDRTDAPLLNEQDLREIDWSSIILFGGGLTLGKVLSSSGLAEVLGNLLFSSVGENLWMLALLASAIAILVSEFSSNTAAAAILVPIVIAKSTGFPEMTSAALVIMTVFACGFGFMLPVSTPPNAMVFGSRKLALKDMVCSGAVLDIVGLLLLPAFGVIVLPRIIQAVSSP